MATPQGRDALALSASAGSVSRSEWFYTEKLGRKPAVTLGYIYFSNLFFLRAGDEKPQDKSEKIQIHFPQLNPWNICDVKGVHQGRTRMGYFLKNEQNKDSSVWKTRASF